MSARERGDMTPAGDIAVDAADELYIRGNNAADVAATAVARAALPSDIAVRALEKAYELACRDLALAARLLAVWSQLASAGRVVRKANAALVRLRPTRPVGGPRPSTYRTGWRCASCGLVAFSMRSRCWAAVA